MGAGWSCAAVRRDFERRVVHLHPGRDPVEPGDHAQGLSPRYPSEVWADERQGAAAAHPGGAGDVCVADRHRGVVAATGARGGRRRPAVRGHVGASGGDVHHVQRARLAGAGLADRGAAAAAVHDPAGDGGAGGVQ